MKETFKNLEFHVVTGKFTKSTHAIYREEDDARSEAKALAKQLSLPADKKVRDYYSDKAGNYVGILVHRIGAKIFPDT